jgi:hypothetical protein
LPCCCSIDDYLVNFASEKYTAITCPTSNDAVALVKAQIALKSTQPMMSLSSAL